MPHRPARAARAASPASTRWSRAITAKPPTAIIAPTLGKNSVRSASMMPAGKMKLLDGKKRDTDERRCRS